MIGTTLFIFLTAAVECICALGSSKKRDCFQKKRTSAESCKAVVIPGAHGASQTGFFQF